MRRENIMFSSSAVPIISIDGKKEDEIKLPEKIYPVPRRRCGISKMGLHYKGAGIIYTGHYVNDYDPEDSRLSLVEKTGISYEKYHVIYPALYRRYGIFLFLHQPIFSDFEGACGKKEQNLIAMQKKFHYSAIAEIVDVLPTPLPEHFIYVYRMKEVTGNYYDTLRLIEYILVNGYNTAWDKNVWDDIYCFGYLRDLADWFVSERFCHKLGTIFALLNSLIKKDKYLYEIIVRELTGLEQLGDYHIIYIAALIVKKYVPDCTAQIDLTNLTAETYRQLWHELYKGTACCHLQNNGKWNGFRREMESQIDAQVDLAIKDLYYHRIMSLKK